MVNCSWIYITMFNQIQIRSTTGYYVHAPQRVTTAMIVSETKALVQSWRCCCCCCRSTHWLTQLWAMGKLPLYIEYANCSLWRGPEYPSPWQEDQVGITLLYDIGVLSLMWRRVNRLIKAMEGSHASPSDTRRYNAIVDLTWTADGIVWLMSWPLMA